MQHQARRAIEGVLITVLSPILIDFIGQYVKINKKLFLTNK
jgi:hypothetical protein